ncbi:ABC transporter permease [Actinoplanes sp. Pm04-4]|uniref:ABC transporter permease n=1 Tax=Paractinoplanes pyxinae TaxID=2997416 RepID=A0ABT4BAU0_9ACTN|nr:ABC transporter permease [Actinoplanes pyxinae]MCY1143624.1 ABC transporter permease [Actinoplanes pyxinae]
MKETRAGLPTVDAAGPAAAAEPTAAGGTRRWIPGTPVAFAALVVLFAVLRPQSFLSTGNLRNTVEQIAILAVVAAVQTVVMAVGEFDLSVGALVSLTGVVAAHLMLDGTPVAPAILAAVLTGTAVGVVNGVLVAWLRLSAFVATLAVLTALAGTSLLLTDGSTLFGLPAGFVAIGRDRLGGVPVLVIVAAVAAAVVWFLLAHTSAGARWYAVGGNAEAAWYAGIDARWMRLAAFVVSGAGAGVAGVLLTSRLASAHPTAGDGLMLTSIAAVFLGMTASRSGRVTVGGTLLGVAVLGVLDNGLNLLQIDTYVQQVLTGLILIYAVALSRRREARR